MSSSNDGGGGGFSLAGVDHSKAADVFGSLDALEKKHDAVVEQTRREGDSAGLIKDDPVFDDLFSAKKQGNRGNRDSGRDYRDRDRDRDSGRDNRDRDRSRDSDRNETDRDRDRERNFRSQSDFQERKDRRNEQQTDSAGFKVPQGRPPRNKVPEHALQPEKFKHYNLSDTPDSSERSNSAAAFDFLNDLRKRREEKEKADAGEKMEVDEGEEEGKIVFRKPTAKTDSSTEKKALTGGFGGKLVMPEYVVGQTKKAEKKSTSISASLVKKSSTTPSAISLGHLDDEEDGDEQNKDGGAAISFKKVTKAKKGQLRQKVDDDNDEEEKGEEKQGLGTKRKVEEDDEEEKEADEEEGVIVRRDRAAERRKKSRGKLFQRTQIVDRGSEEEDEEEWQEEIRKAREEEEKEEAEQRKGKEDKKEEDGEQEEESMEDMGAEGI